MNNEELRRQSVDAGSGLETLSIRAFESSQNEGEVDWLVWMVCEWHMAGIGQYTRIYRKHTCTWRSMQKGANLSCCAWGIRQLNCRSHRVQQSNNRKTRKKEQTTLSCI